MSRNIAGRTEGHAILLGAESPTFVHVMSEQGFIVLQSEMLVIINYKSKLEIGGKK